MIYTKAERVIENNKVQTLVSYEDALKYFKLGASLWFFIEDYEEVETDDFSFEGYEDAQDYKYDCFQMTCINSDTDELQDVDPMKKYYIPKEDI